LKESEKMEKHKYIDGLDMIKETANVGHFIEAVNILRQLTIKSSDN
jgi:hypothetical protein